VVFMTRPTISVLIATYNRAALLADCLESIREQPFESGDEVIIVDNASTDETAAVIERFARSASTRVLTLLEREPGKTPALATGIARASGTILALTDDDVCVGRGWITTIRQRFGADPELALLAGRIDPRPERPWPTWLVLGRERFGRLSAPLGLVHYGEAQPLGPRSALGGNVAIRRDVLNALGGFAKQLGRIRGTLLCGEDHELSQRIVTSGYRAVYDPALCVRHWVPLERARLSYFLRWSFWAGATHSLMDAQNGGRDVTSVQARVPRYLWKRAVMAAVQATTELVRGRGPLVVERLMDGGFAIGYISDRLSSGRLSLRTGRGPAPHAGRLPSARADTNPPAVPIPDERAGESRETIFGELEVEARVKQVAGQPAMRGIERKAEGL
jgi:GT2 family glycosyltransferase